MRNASFDPQSPRSRRPRRPGFGPRAQAQFTVDMTAGPAPWPRSHRGGPGHFGGPPGFGGPGGFGPGGPGGRGGARGRGGHGRGGRGRRAGRGDVRAAILLLLAEQPMHGYQIIQEITERTSGAWTPSPGAVDPAIGLLTDEGLVVTTADGGRNLASLTVEGRAYVEANAAELGNPWESAAGRGPHRRFELRSAVEALIDATRQVGRVGSDDQVAAALAVLENARREIYLILAEADTKDTDDGAMGGAPAAEETISEMGDEQGDGDAPSSTRDA